MVKHGNKNIASVYTAMLTGDFEHHIPNEAYKELFRAAVESKEPLNRMEADALVQITDGVLHCLRNPEDYLPDAIK